MMQITIQRISVGQMQANCYFVIDDETNDLIIIDPGDDAVFLTDKIQAENLHPKAMIATHGHFDHVMAAFELQANYEIPFYIHPKDEFLLKRMQDTASYFLQGIVVPPKVKDVSFYPEEKLKIDQFEFQLIKTPGHTPGSVSLLIPEEKAVFVGDVVFAEGNIGRTDFAYCNKNQLLQSITHLLELPETTIVYSGHGEETNIEELKQFFLE